METHIILLGFLILWFYYKGDNIINGVLIWIQTLYNNWNKDRVASRAAALAYYTLFSLAPILLISISLAGTFLAKKQRKAK